MTTCERMRERLPGLAAGEVDEAGASAHVRDCAACRDEERRLREDLADLRRQWPAPSPASRLRNRLLTAARGERAAALLAPRALSWWTAGGALAAVLLAGVGGFWWIGRAAHEGVPAGPAAGPPRPDARAAAEADTRVWQPPPHARLQRARAGNRVSLDEPGEQLGGGMRLVERAIAWPGGEVERVHPEVLPPGEERAPLLEPTGAVHRWVYGADESRGALILSTRRRPGADEVLLGASLLARAAREAWPGWPTAQQIQRLSETPPTQGEPRVVPLELASPDGSLVARVVATPDPTLAVDVLVPEALARALCLQQFEIPGAAQHDTLRLEEWRGRRSRVRVRVAAAGVDELRPAVFAEPPSLGGAAQDTLRLTLTGERPRWIYVRVGLRRLATGAERPEPLDVMSGDVILLAKALDSRGEGTWLRASPEGEVLSFSWTPPPARTLDELPPPDGLRLPDPLDAARLLLAGLDPGSHELHIERLVLPGPFPPGARATLARVWAGSVAVAAAEGVGSGIVSADGTLTLPRLRAAATEAQRLRLVAPDGAVRWYEVQGSDAQAAEGG